jgi:hypothetical protein
MTTEAFGRLIACQSGYQGDLDDEAITRCVAVQSAERHGTINSRARGLCFGSQAAGEFVCQCWTKDPQPTPPNARTEHLAGVVLTKRPGETGAFV